MERLHPDDIKEIARQVAAEMRKPVIVPGRAPLAAVPQAELEARLRSEGVAVRSRGRRGGRQ
jgi:hypothetical protein